MKVMIARMVVIHGGLPVVQDYKGNEHIGAREFDRRVPPGSPGEVSDHRGEGLTRMKEVREPRVSVTKIFNPKEKRDQSPRARVRRKRS